LEAVREGQVGQPGVTDFGPGVERSSGPCAGSWQRQAKEAYDEEPSAWEGKLSETQRTLPDQAGPGVTDELWIDLRFQEAFAWRALRLPAKFPDSNRQLPECQNTELLVRRQRRGHRQRHQQAFPAATLPSPHGAHWGAQERRGCHALG